MTFLAVFSLIYLSFLWTKDFPGAWNLMGIVLGNHQLHSCRHLVRAPLVFCGPDYRMLPSFCSVLPYTSRCLSHFYTTSGSRKDLEWFTRIHKIQHINFRSGSERTNSEVITEPWMKLRQLQVTGTDTLSLWKTHTHGFELHRSHLEGIPAPLHSTLSLRTNCFSFSVVWSVKNISRGRKGVQKNTKL